MPGIASRFAPPNAAVSADSMSATIFASGSSVREVKSWPAVWLPHFFLNPWQNARRRNGGFLQVKKYWARIAQEMTNGVGITVHCYFSFLCHQAWARGLLAQQLFLLAKCVHFLLASLQLQSERNCNSFVFICHFLCSPSKKRIAASRHDCYLRPRRLNVKLGGPHSTKQTMTLQLNQCTSMSFRLKKKRSWLAHIVFSAQLPGTARWCLERFPFCNLFLYSLLSLTLNPLPPNIPCFTLCRRYDNTSTSVSQQIPRPRVAGPATLHKVTHKTTALR